MKKSAIKLTPEKSEWLKSNYKKFRNIDLVAELDITEYQLSICFKEFGLKKINRVPGGKKKDKKNQEKFEHPKRNWLPGQYSNFTREQHVERILSMTI
jgi:hypothetical protein